MYRFGPKFTFFYFYDGRYYVKIDAILPAALTALNNPKLKIHNWKCGERFLFVLLCEAILKKTHPTRYVMNLFSSYFFEDS